MKKIGILSLQGAVSEHIRMIKKCGAIPQDVKTKEDLQEIDALIIPGGESTTIGKLLKVYNLDKEIKDIYKNKKIPIFGTCAGMILLAKEIEGSSQEILGLIDIKVRRNGFGRQKFSFETKLKISFFKSDFMGVFIRAPYILEKGKNVEVLATFEEKIVFAKEKNILVCSFHPELTEDMRIHKYFLEMIK